MTDHVEPLRNARIITLIFTWATASVSGALGLYSLVKTNQTESMLRKSTPATLTFDIHAMFIAGLILTIGTTILATVITNVLQLYYFPMFRRGAIPLSTRTLTLQKFFFLFMAIWITANMIAYSVVFATGEVVVVAKLGPLTLPPSLVQQQAKAMGVESLYRRIYYLRWSEIFNWFTVLFSWITTIITFKAASQAKNVTASGARSSVESADTVDQEKGTAVMTENVDAPAVTTTATPAPAAEA